MDNDDESNKGPIECRAAVAISELDKNEIVFLPSGVHEITPVSGGIGRPIKVFIDQSTAGEIERQRAAITARTGKKVYFDFNHEDGAASFWPELFSWKPKDGVVAKGEWSASGKKAVEGKDYRAFSPVFHVDDKRADPAKVICFDGARVNMGGLVNDPAFNNLPMWAKNDGTPVAAGASSETKPKEKVTMTPEEIAALQAKKTEQETKIAELEAIIAKNSDDDSSRDELKRLKAEAETSEAQLEVERLKAQNAIQAKELEKRNRVVAEETVRRAVKRGALPAKNIRLQHELVAKATIDPSFNDIIDGFGGNNINVRDRFVPERSGVSIVNDDPMAVYAKMASLLQESARSSSHEDKARIAVEVGAIYAGAFKDTEKNQEQRTRLINSRLNVVNDAIMAADVTDANLGTIAGTLVTLRTLELLKFVFPALARFTTDFSDQPANYNQTIMTRIVTIPNVVAYSTATGWADASCCDNRCASGHQQPPRRSHHLQREPARVHDAAAL